MRRFRMQTLLQIGLLIGASSSVLYFYFIYNLPQHNNDIEFDVRSSQEKSDGKNEKYYESNFDGDKNPVVPNFDDIPKTKIRSPDIRPIDIPHKVQSPDDAPNEKAPLGSSNVKMDKTPNVKSADAANTKPLKRPDVKSADDSLDVKSPNGPSIKSMNKKHSMNNEADIPEQNSKNAAEQMNVERDTLKNAKQQEPNKVHAQNVDDELKAENVGIKSDIKLDKQAAKSPENEEVVEEVVEYSDDTNKDHDSNGNGANKTVNEMQLGQKELHDMKEDAEQLEVIHEAKDGQSNSGNRNDGQKSELAQDQNQQQPQQDTAKAPPQKQDQAQAPQQEQKQKMPQQDTVKVPPQKQDPKQEQKQNIPQQDTAKDPPPKVPPQKKDPAQAPKQEQKPKMPQQDTVKVPPPKQDQARAPNAEGKNEKVQQDQKLNVPDKTDSGKLVFKKPSEREMMHLAVVACGERVADTLAMIKSACIVSAKKIHVHIFSDDGNRPIFQQMLSSSEFVKNGKLRFTVYPITYPRGQSEEWIKLFRPCATQRLFLPDVLPDVELVLYVDTDILFLQSMDAIWRFFDDFNATHIAALAPEHEDPHVGWYNRFARHPYYPPLGLNSGVMLMNLSRMREVKFVDLMPPYFKQYKYSITWGDQDLLNIYFHFFPEKLLVYPCQWNYRPDHCMYMSVCKTAEEFGAMVLHGCRQVFYNDKQPAFKAIFQAFQNHKTEEGLSSLVAALKSNLDQVKQTNCGRVKHIFMKVLEDRLRR